MRLTAILAAAVTGLGLSLSAPVQAEELVVCLEEDAPPLSFSFGKREGGFDYGVAQEVAKRLGRDFRVQWFEGENDEENVPAWEANALLSDGRCNIIGGYPMLQSALGKPEPEKGLLPDYKGKKRSERLRMVKLGVLDSTTPYYRTGFGLIRGPKQAEFTLQTLAQIEDRSIGFEVGMITGALVHRYRNGVLVNQSVSVRASEGLLDKLEAGEFDTALVEVYKYDNFLRRNPEAGQRFTGYVHPLGINMGFAILERDKDLKMRIDAVLDEMKVDGTLARIAEEWQVTYLRPQPPKILKRIRPAMLTGD